MENILKRKFPNDKIIKLGDIAHISDATRLVYDENSNLVEYKKVTFTKLSSNGEFIVDNSTPVDKAFLNSKQFRKFLTEGDIILPKKATKKLKIGIVGKCKDNLIANNGMIRVILKDKSISLQVQRYLELPYIQKFILDSFNINQDKRCFLNSMILKNLPIPKFAANESFNIADKALYEEIQVINSSIEALQQQKEVLISSDRFELLNK